MATTTSATYDDDYAAAFRVLCARLGIAPAGSAVLADDDAERRKSAADALNNTWGEGSTIDAWVAAAEAALRA